MKNKIKNLIFDIVNKAIPLSKITDTANLADELGFDSLMFVSLVGALEKGLNVKIDPDEINLDNFKNIESITSFLKNKGE